MKKFSFILIIFLLSSYLIGCDKDDVKTFSFNKTQSILNLKKLDTLNLKGFDEKDIIFLLGMASVIEKDTLSNSRAHIIYGITSDFVQSQIADNKFNIKNNNTLYILDFLKSKKYHYNTNSPTDFEKLIHYIEIGEYGHIWIRIKGKSKIIFSSLILLSLIIIYYKFKH